MLRRCRKRIVKASRLSTTLYPKSSAGLAPCQSLPFANETFDCAVLHLIVAVVPEPQRALSEAARVVRRGGTLHVLDKFLAPGARAPLRRLLNPLASRIATRTDVVFEHFLEREPRLRVISDEPAMARGWVRRIVLARR